MYAGLFEAHITVAPMRYREKAAFRAFAEKHDAKTVLIELARGDTPVQPMLSSRHSGTLAVVKTEVKLLAQKVQEAGFPVKRVKIEAAPFNADIPLTRAEQALHPAENYFEHHAKLKLHYEEDLAPLMEICKKYQAHLSKNAYKKLYRGYYERFVTVRSYALGLEEAASVYSAMHDNLHAAGYHVLKSETEYCVYDSNLSLDNNWLEILE